MGEVYTPTKSCSKCKRNLPHEAFNRYARRPDGLQNYCKECASAYRAKFGPAYNVSRRDKMREYNRAYYVAHRTQLIEQASANQRTPERVAYRLQWARENRASRNMTQRRRRAVRAIPYTLATLRAKWVYWSGACWLCGGAADTWDHVKPLARGGIDCLANLRPACRSCNASKNDRWPLA